MTNDIIREWSEFAQRDYKARYVLVGKVIYWELCKKLKFDHTTNWYMHKPESILENETHKILRDVEIQTDHRILARRPDRVIITKKKKRENLPTSGLCRPGGPQSKNQRKRKEREVLRPCQRTKKMWNLRVTRIPIIFGALVTVPTILKKELEELEIQGQIKTMQTIGLLRPARILRKVLET